ncbi:hypothetical protein MAPG_04257 [Magnaporthiopsis poae ATCC 64411]|uniref:Cytochrome P450-DIT2 n=1 Tax=Magnaporthiopsis poae (strain ATCC 64411 / 73-15) TaxID=644358 RepID=A0A0C4DW83_MAGP6|nr:hypothetical protein MAPG_04257 [Magnaporthiopsis poae ATCC 64411]
MITLIAELLLAGALLAASLFWFFLLPPRHPRDVPAIPFWVALVPFFREVDQADTFKRYVEGPLRRRGAVKIFFSGQWNILLHRPSYLLEIFKQEEIFQKSGNQKKIPHSVLAAFLGDNIITGRADDWKAYKSVIKPGLQRTSEVDILERNAALLCNVIDTTRQVTPGGVTHMQDLLQRYSMANCAGMLLQVDLPQTIESDVPLNTLQLAVKREIFKPVFLNFPFLDRLPLPSRMYARKLVRDFRHQLQSALETSHAAETTEKTQLSSNKLGARLLGALRSGIFNQKQFLDNLLIVFVAGQENPQLGMISMMYLLAKHPEIQDQLYAEISKLGGDSTLQQGQALPQDPCAASQVLEDIPLMTAIILESLRLFPPIAQLINRRVAPAEGALLGGTTYIPQGTYVGYSCYSTNRDPTAWGPDENGFRPGRWGSSAAEIQQQYKQRRARGEFISFHGGIRACLGEKMALLEMRVTLWVLVGRFRWALDPTWPDRMTPSPA